MIRFVLLCALTVTSLWAAAPAPHATVAADGSGTHRTIQEAINAVPQTTSADSPWVILVKPGTYSEVVYVQREKRYVHLLGEDAATTIITAALHANVIGPDGKAIGTFRTPTVYVDAENFTAENITFANAAGPVGQALALRLDGDRARFFHCRFLGWQDTILVNRGRHYFRECYVEGAVDFIFGGATSVFDRCHIHCSGRGYITAASTPLEQKYGLVFFDCKITAANAEATTYLGRPWRDYAATAFIRTEMPAQVKPEGWHNWSKPNREVTSRYQEFGTTGPGASTQRVSWAKPLPASEVETLTPATVLRGADQWNPLEQR